MTEAKQTSPLYAVSRWAWVPAAIAFSLAAARYMMQSPRSLYTNFERHFYEPGPLTWVKTEESWFWLGGDALAVLGGMLVVMAIISAWSRRALAGKSLTGQRLASFFVVSGLVAGLAAIFLPVIAFSTGLPPDAVRAEPPALGGASADAVDGEGFAQGVAGTFEVVDHETSHIISKLSAGGEDFIGQFNKPGGSFTFDPRRIKGAAVKADVWIEAATIETENELRDKHASGEDYLKSEAHPRITVAFEEVTSLRVEPSGDLVHFEGAAQVSLLGVALPYPVKGQLKQLDAGTRAELKLEDREAYHLQAEFIVDITKTPLASARADGSFDKDTIPIQVSLILQRSK